MMRSKTWIKDRYFGYVSGKIVKLVRKKKNGHPRALELGKCYRIKRVENYDLFVETLEGEHIIVKVHKDYFVPIQEMRDELINDILSND
jgi:hypothetical protein